MKQNQLEQWLAQAADGTLPDAERQQLDRWLEQSLDDRWTPDVDAAWSRVADRIVRSERTRRCEIVSSRVGLAVAAAVLVLAAFVLTRYFLPADSSQVITADQPGIACPLDDGSRMTLARGATAVYSQTADSRRVKLDGTAHFDVANDADRPFTVEVDGAEVRVVGTCFDVQSFGNDLSVQVYEGEVQVVTPQANSRLHAGDVWTLTDGRITLAASTDRKPRWTAAELIYVDRPLTEVVADLQRFYGRRIHLADPAAAARCLVSTGFSTESFGEALAELQQLLGFTIAHRADSTVVIQPFNCE